MEEAVGRIQQLEAALQQQVQNAAFLQQTLQQQQATINGLTAVGAIQNANIQCWVCGIFGHMGRNCPSKGK
eukprot:8449868-Karenia_brevis.AAC.1